MSVLKHILVCPLDWGLGHATRSIPLVKMLLERGARVTLAADGQAYDFLVQELPTLPIIRLRGYGIAYPQGGWMALHMLMMMPRILMGIAREHHQLRKIIKTQGIDVVISDNRFGLWTRRAYCIYMSHQLMIKCPPMLRFLEPVLHGIHALFISKYNECWVPDLALGQTLSGDLSHKYPLPANAFFIGPLSRFERPRIYHYNHHSRIYNILAILSGPEPQRTNFERVITEQLKGSHISACLVRGVPADHTDCQVTEKLRVVGCATANTLSVLIQYSAVVLCRPGYSSLMDLAVMGKAAVLVPTPGQTEQEYLADYLSDKGQYVVMRQDQLDIQKAIAQLRPEQARALEPDRSLLDKRITSVLQSCK